MQYLCNKHELEQFYPKDPAKRAMIDSAMFYLVGTLYPYLARATYPALGFPQYAGEVGHSEADAATKEKARQAAVEALAEPLEVFHRFYHGRQTVHRRRQTLDRRHPPGCHARISAVIDYPLPDWARTYMADMEKALGDAYSEPAADVRGYIAYVRSSRA